MEITHEDFIKKLKDVGFNISTKGVDLYVNGIKIDNTDYILFSKKKFVSEDFEKAIKTCSKTLMEELTYIKRIPTYYDCKNFLLKKFGKTKVESDAIKRVLDLLKNNYQELHRFVALSKTIENNN